MPTKAMENRGWSTDTWEDKGWEREIGRIPLNSPTVGQGCQTLCEMDEDGHNVVNLSENPPGFGNTTFGNKVR